MHPPKRYRLSLLARRTQHMLFGLLIGLALTLFVVQLFVMNHLSMSGYVLTKELTLRTELADQHEKLDAAIAKAQTQEYVYKGSGKTNFVAKDMRQTESRRNEVVVGLRLSSRYRHPTRAQKPGISQ